MGPFASHIWPVRDAAVAMVLGGRSSRSGPLV